VPFLVTLVAGDILAGEATAGTYRLLLTRPLSRFTLVTSKYMAVLISTNALVLFMAAMSLGLGTLMLGTGEVVVIRSKITILAQNDALWRFVLAYGYAALGMTTVSSIAFLLSSLVENAIGPIMTTMAIIIVLLILTAVTAPWMDNVRPYFFTTHMNGWRYLFDTTVDWPRVLNSTAVLLTHCVGCYLGALLIIQRKDILT
jgi:ABC-2 type transport system permease protein